MTGANGQAVELLTINGRIVEIDSECPSFVRFVRVMNENGFPTQASCWGHGFRPPSILWQPGLPLGCGIHFSRDREEWARIEALFPLDINGNPV